MQNRTFPLFSAPLWVFPVLVGASLPCASADPDGGDMLAQYPKTVFIQVEYIEVSMSEYANYIFHHDGRFDSDLVRREVQGLIEAGEAELKDVVMVQTRSGQRAKTESIHEVIYPTEYEPGQVQGREKGTSQSKSETISTTKSVADAPIGQPKFPPPGAYPTPTAFETRNAGATLEVDPVIGADGKTIDLNIAPEHVRLVGRRTWQRPVIDGKEIETVVQPDFYTLKTSTAVTVANGSYSLVSVEQPADDEGQPIPGRKWLVFVKAWTETVLPADVENDPDDGSHGE